MKRTECKFCGTRIECRNKQSVKKFLKEHQDECEKFKRGYK